MSARGRPWCNTLPPPQSGDPQNCPGQSTNATETKDEPAGVARTRPVGAPVVGAEPWGLEPQECSEGFIPDCTPRKP